MDLNREALDRHITGNWGEDQFATLPDEYEVDEQSPENAAEMERLANEEAR